MIGALLLVNGCLAFNEDLRARQAMRELVKSLQIMVRVKREGEWKERPARELVPGDLLRYVSRRGERYFSGVLHSTRC